MGNIVKFPDRWQQTKRQTFLSLAERLSALRQANQISEHIPQINDDSFKIEVIWLRISSFRNRPLHELVETILDIKISDVEETDWIQFAGYYQALVDEFKSRLFHI